MEKKKNTDIKIGFYASLIFSVIVIILVSVYISHKITSSDSLNNLDKVPIRSIKSNDKKQNLLFSPVEQARMLEDVYSKVEKNNSVYVCMGLKEEELKRECISHYYTLRASRQQNPRECLKIKDYFPKSSYEVGCVVYYSISTYENFCDILSDTKKINVCNTLYNLSVKGFEKT